MSAIREPKVVRLVWDEGDLAGVEIALRVAHVDQLFALGDLARLDVGDLQAGRISTDNMQRFHRLVEAFGDALLAWNLQERHPVTGVVAPVPATAQGVRGQDSSLVLLAAVAWMDVLSGSVRPGQPAQAGDADDADVGPDVDDEADDEDTGGLPDPGDSLTPAQIADLPMEVLAS